MSRIQTSVCLIALLALVLALAGCKKQEAPQAPAERPPTPVEVVSAVTEDVPLYLDAIGRTVATEIVSIVPQVGGKVIATHVEDGADVKKGQLLFEIDARPFQAALASAQAALAQAKADRQQARVEFNRVKGLIESSAVSQIEYETRQNALAVAEAKVEAAEAAVQTAELDLEYTKVFSPIDGRSGARLVDAGNVVRANDRPMLVIQRLEPIYAEFTVTENDLGTVRKFIATAGLDLGLEPHKGLTVLVDVPGDSQPVQAALGQPRPATQPGKYRGGPREGTLTFLDNTVQEGAGTVKARALLPNADRYFWPGQFVNVRIVLAVKKGAVLIPAQAQQIGQMGPYVYVVAADGTAEMRPIVPGQRHGERMVVEKGLEPNDPVITVGHMLIRPGAKVRVVSNPTAAAH